MFTFVLGLLLTAASIVFWTLYQAYRHVPARELKRRARGGDEAARRLYRAAAYGASLRVLLAGTAVVSGALALTVFAAVTGSVWWALVILAALLGLGGFIFVPGDELTNGNLWLAKHAAPAIAWLLERLHSAIDRGVRLLRKHRRVHVPTGLYEKADLAELLEQQKGQPDSRIGENEIELLQHALTFGERLVSDALVPQRVVKMVAASDAIGPVLMDELARSGHSRFPVHDGRADNIVGILYLHDLVGARSGGKVADVMSRKLTYVHEDFTLLRALQAFLKTKRHLFLVVNGSEELVGIITIEDVLEQMTGKPIMDEFDHYDDLRAVAAAMAKKEHTEHVEGRAEPEEPTPDAKEMVK